MAHHVEPTGHLTHEELKYREHTERAAHFIKIDLFRSAREEFREALKYRPDDAHCFKGIALMNDNIARDRKSVLAVLPFVIAIILGVILFA